MLAEVAFSPLPAMLCITAVQPLFVIREVLLMPAPRLHHVCLFISRHCTVVRWNPTQKGRLHLGGKHTLSVSAQLCAGSHHVQWMSSLHVCMCRLLCGSAPTLTA